MSGLPTLVNNDLRQLAHTTLAAIQDLVRAIEIARGVSERGDPADSELFLQTLWRMLHAERLCDELSRQSRVTIVRTLHAAPVGLLMASDLAAMIEKASDSLLGAGHALRKMVLAKTGMST
jgi:ABC-type arginine transport system ATPase subunit